MPFVFDLDGTLVDSLPGIAEGLNRALRSLGLAEHSCEAVRGMIGRGAANLCAAAIGYADAAEAPAELLEAVHGAFRREYPLCWQGGTRPFPGIPELLGDLAAAGHRLAVLSNKPHEVTLPLVRALFPDVPFDPIAGQRAGVPRKPDPTALLGIVRGWGLAPQEVTLIGDSPFDALTARNAGCRLVLMRWGYARPEELSSWGAPLCADAAELRALLLS